jgi:2-keto-3-deoxy-L-rhamnonate aldolase RhmA
VRRANRYIIASFAVCALGTGALHAQQQPERIYNTAKQKLDRGEQIFGGTVTSSDPDIYCAMANPPQGKRSLGSGQYGAIWGSDYRATAKDNIMIVAMIESPAGVGLADQIAAVPGVDVVFAASTDLASFSGLRQGDADYEAMVTAVHDATLEAGRMLGGPQAWRDRDGFTFFQAPSEATFIRMGVERSLAAPASGRAPIEGAER